jgi:hypothetical protein
MSDDYEQYEIECQRIRESNKKLLGVASIQPFSKCRMNRIVRLFSVLLLMVVASVLVSFSVLASKNSLSKVDAPARKSDVLPHTVGNPSQAVFSTVLTAPHVFDPGIPPSRQGVGTQAFGAPIPRTGDQKLLVILVDFPDRTGLFTGTAWQQRFFGAWPTET